MRNQRPRFRTAGLSLAVFLSMAGTPALAGGSHSGSGSGSRSGSHSGSHSSSHSGSHSGSRSGSHSSTGGGHRSGHPGSLRGGGSPGYRAGPRPGHSGTHYHFHPIPPVPAYAWFGGGCSWLWSSWSCWAPGAQVLVLADPGGDAWVGEDPSWTRDDETDEASDEDGEFMPVSFLLFDVSPADSVVYVDERFAGTASELNDLEDGLPVPPGDHEVTVARPGYREITLSVETLDGKGERVDVELKVQPEGR